MKQAALVVGVAISLMLWADDRAFAGTYSVVACGDAAHGVNHSWHLTSDTTGKLEARDECDAQGDYSGLYIRDVIGVPNATAGVVARWTFEAPGDTTITAVSYSRWLYKEDDDDWAPTVRADGTPLDSCSIVYPAVRCASGAAGGLRTSTTISSADSLSVELRCSATSPTTCSNGGTLHAAVASIYAVTVSLTDFTTPAISDVAGPVGTGEYQAGSQLATFSATDNTGIRLGRIYVDGALAASATYACDFTYAVPCSNKTDAEVALDTRSLSDGPHSVQVAAVDPAGNETRSAPRSIVVDNGAPFAPDSLSVDGGADWRSANSFDVSWVNPADSGAPITSAHYVLCAVDGSGCLAEQETAGSGIDHLSDISVPSPGAWALRVWLEDGAGNVDSANAAELTLRYGSDPAATTSEPSPPSTEPSVDPAPAISDPLTPPSLDPTPAPTASTTATRLDPRLRLTSARLIHGRLLLRGRAATTAAGPLTLTIRARRGHSLRRHITIRGGRFSVVVRTRKGTRPRSVLARFAGTPAFRPATASLRLRG